MKPIDVRAAQHAARKHSRAIRHVGDLPGYDVVVLENRATGERRKVPKKYMLMAGGDYAVAFEMVPPGPGFEDQHDASTDE
jgi:hypothetical protein